MELPFFLTESTCIWGFMVDIAACVHVDNFLFTGLVAHIEFLPQLVLGGIMSNYAWQQDVVLVLVLIGHLKAE
jgi:hypothetical protein